MQAQAFILDDGLIQVTGQDKLSYLHGQLTQDMNLVTDGQFKWTGHCSPKGKLWGVFRLFKESDSYILWGSKSEIEASLRELKKYGVFAKVEIAQAERVAIGIITDSITSTLSQLNVEPIEGQNAYYSEALDAKVLVLDDKRLVVFAKQKPELPDTFTYLPDNALWYLASISAGEPRLDTQSIDEYVPQMVNLQALNGISFKKGCYTGQETVARMRYLGKNKRAMFIVSAQVDSLPESLDLEMALETNWRRANTPTHFAFDTHTKEFSALVVLPNDTTADTVLRFKDSPETHLTIQALPYSLEDSQ